MKKLTCVLLFALCLQSVKAQVIPPNVAKPELWESSRRLRRTGFFLLGTGVVTTLVGVGKAYGEVLNSFWGGTPKPGNSSTILAGGLITMAGSIPLFIIAGNKKRASFAFNQSSDLNLPQGVWVYKTPPQVQFTFTQKLF